MTDVNAINGYTLTGSSSASTSSSSQTLSADMNTFLTLLTTQLKYQDPLDPMDTADFTNQLVQYSSVEQAIQTNSKLDSLLSLYTSNLGAQAVSYIGKVAQVLGDVMPLQDGQAKAAYTLDKDVKSVTIYVKDLNGNTVYSTNGETSSGTHEFDWDGKTSGGQQLEDGAYQIIIPSFNIVDISAGIRAFIIVRAVIVETHNHKLLSVLLQCRKTRISVVSIL